MKVAVFDTHKFEKGPFGSANRFYGHDLAFLETKLTAKTAVLANGFPAVCCFVNDQLDGEALAALVEQGVQLIALRSAGYNHVDLKAAESLNLTVVRVPAYSPHAVAEHAVALILSLNRKIHKAYIRVRELNFSLEGLVGFDLYQKTVGVIGTGKIGSAFAGIMKGFGCEVLAFDIEKNSENEAAGVRYVELSELYRRSDIVSLHLPLNAETRHLIGHDALAQMKAGTMLVNTGRGALVDAKALIDSLKSGHIGGAALDVYEEEENVFFSDLSESGLADDVLARLLTFPNVLVTAHQGFLTREALGAIAETTLKNIADFEQGRELSNVVRFIS